MIVVSQDGKTVFPLEQVMLRVERVGWGAKTKYGIVFYPMWANPLTEDPTVAAEFTKEEDAGNALMDLLSSYQRDVKVFAFGIYNKEQK